MRVPIPRETLEKIKRDYNLSEEKATRLYLNAFDEAESHFWSVIEDKMNEEGKGKGSAPTARLFTPREVKAYLDKYVIGQEEYKKRLAIAAAFHFAMLRFMRENPRDIGFKRFRKKNTLIAGPSGSGKTYCVEVLGDLLEIPTLIVDATDYTEAGYVGKSADDMIRELIDMAPGATRQEQAEYITKYGAIIFVDELDKKAREGAIGHDISREGFQRAILKLVERKTVAIENPMSPSAQIQDLMDRQRGKKKQDNNLSTEKILFILGGSFQRSQDNLEMIIRKRLSRKAATEDEHGNMVIGGFGASQKKDSDNEYKSYYSIATEEDFIKFGLIPELVGRTPIRSHVNHLSKNDLIRIMTDTEDSILRQYQVEFKTFNLELNFSDDAVEWIAERAEKAKTGARALIGVLEEVLTEFQYELPGTQHRNLLITREVCEQPKDYLLRLLARSPFEDYADSFQSEFGIALEFTPEAEEYVRKYAEDGHIQISDALKILLSGASALNYMGFSGKYTISRDMLEDPKYFDNIYVEWHKRNVQSPESGKADKP